MLRLLQHSATVGAGFIPVLPTADKIQSKYNAAARTGINPAPYGGYVQRINYQCVANEIHLQGRPSWPSGRSTDLISVAFACFDGFPLCQRQDPTEEDLPFGALRAERGQPLTNPQSPNGKGRKSLALTTGFYRFWSQFMIVYSTVLSRGLHCQCVTPNHR